MRRGRWPDLGGALGALEQSASFSLSNGGIPTYVMPLVFAGAPLVMCSSRCGNIPERPNPLLYPASCWPQARNGALLAWGWQG